MTTSESLTNYTRDEARRIASRAGVTREQFNFLIKLAREHVLPTLGSNSDERIAAIIKATYEGDITYRTIRYWIGKLKHQPQDESVPKQPRPGKALIQAMNDTR